MESFRPPVRPARVHASDHEAPEPPARRRRYVAQPSRLRVPGASRPGVFSTRQPLPGLLEPGVDQFGQVFDWHSARVQHRFVEAAELEFVAQIALDLLA